MSLIRKNLKRVAKIVTLISIALVFPNQPASALSISTWSPINTTGVGSQSWISISSNSTGSILYAAAKGNYLYKSTDSGNTWTSLTNSAYGINWYSVATNDSGTIVVAAANYGYLYVSSDSGGTWTQITALGQKNYSHVAMSSSGSKIVATFGQSGYVYSSDSGLNFSTVTPSPAATSLSGITISGDGSKIAFEAAEGIYLSSNSGSTWTKFTGLVSSSNLASSGSISMSADGQKIAFAGTGASDDKIRLTSNFGTSWETSTAPYPGVTPKAVKYSGDGQRLYVINSGTQIYTSGDNGSSWSSAGPPSSQANTISTNYTGTIAAIAAQNTNNNLGLYLTTNSGASWSNISPADGVTTIPKMDASKDGQTIVAINYLHQVWLTRNGGTSWNVAPNIPSFTSWTCVAVSENGSAIYVGGSNTNLWRSLDGGNTFASVTISPFNSLRYFTDCAISNDGSRIAFVLSGLGVYFSSNSGTSFSQILSNTTSNGTISYSSITMTGDGNKIAVGSGTTNTPVFLSTGNFSTWDTVTVNSGNSLMKSSKSGNVLISANSATHTPKISRDWGVSWNPLPSNIGVTFGQGVSISSDGKLILFGQYTSTGNVYMSSDSGVNFNQLSGLATGYQRNVFVTASGNNFLVATDGTRLMRATVSLYAQSYIQSLSLSGSPMYRSNIVVTATTSPSGTDGYITFQEAGKNIAGCVKVPTVSLVATCKWKPTKRGVSLLSVTIYPTDSNYLSGSTTLQVTVGNRTGNR